MVIVKLKPEVKKKTPLQRITEIEESLITEPKDLRKYFYDYLRQFVDDKTTRVDQLRKYIHIVTDISTVLGFQSQDIKEMLANHMLRRKAFELFKTELKRDETVVIVAAGSRKTMDDSLELLGKIADSRKDGITIDDSELTQELK